MILLHFLIFLWLLWSHECIGNSISSNACTVLRWIALSRLKWLWNEWLDSLELYSVPKIFAKLYFEVKKLWQASVWMWCLTDVFCSPEQWFELNLPFLEKWNVLNVGIHIFKHIAAIIWLHTYLSEWHNESSFASEKKGFYVREHKAAERSSNECYDVSNPFSCLGCNSSALSWSVKYLSPEAKWVRSVWSIARWHRDNVHKY